MLGLTTSSAHGGAALLSGGQLVGEAGYDDEMAHAERLFVAIDEVIARAGVARSELGAVACDVGPGSFTGVRVGLAAAKGVALGLGLPLYPVGSLHAMSAAAFGAAAREVRTIVSVLDAKRGELFLAPYSREGDERVVATHLGTAEAAGALATWLDDEAVMICGRAARGLELEPGRISMAPGSELPSAAWIARLGAARWRAGAPPSLSSLEPRYLRAPAAVPNLPPPLFGAATPGEPPGRAARGPLTGRRR